MDTLKNIAVAAAVSGGLVLLLALFIAALSLVVTLFV